MIDFRKLLTDEQRAEWDRWDKYAAEKKSEFQEMDNHNLISTAEYFLTQMPGPYKYARGCPVYDATFFHIILPELFERLKKNAQHSAQQEATMLEGIVRGKLRPPRLVVYGPPKIGKSTLGADAPSPVFVTTEEGVDNLPVDQFPMAASWAHLLANIQQVAGGEHDFQTMVLDTLNGAADLAALHICNTQFKGDWGPGGFGSFAKGWASTSEEMRQLLPLLDKCRGRGMTVLLLAHTGTMTVRNPIDGDYQKFAPDLDRRVWARFSAWSDIILRADYDAAIVERDGKRVAIGDSTRILRAVGSAAEDAGCRVGYNLPEQMPLAWSEIAQHLGGSNGTGEAISELWPLLSKEERGKTLHYLRIESIEKINLADLARAKVVLNRLKAREVKNAS